MIDGIINFIRIFVLVLVYMYIFLLILLNPVLVVFVVLVSVIARAVYNYVKQSGSESAA